MPPWQGGGDMILSVTFEKTIYNALPYKFEAGTPDIAGAIGLGAAIDYLDALGLDVDRRARARPPRVRGGRALGGARTFASSARRASGRAWCRSSSATCTRTTSARCSIATAIAVRAGHHCAQPLMQRLGLAATARASFGLYNTREDVDALVRGLHAVREMFA